MVPIVLHTFFSVCVSHERKQKSAEKSHVDYQTHDIHLYIFFLSFPNDNISLIDIFFSSRLCDNYFVVHSTKEKNTGDLIDNTATLEK